MGSGSEGETTRFIEVWSMGLGSEQWWILLLDRMQSVGNFYEPHPFYAHFGLFR